MPTVIVRLPSMLAASAGGRRELSVVASTVRQALQEIGTAYPLLCRHVLDESGELRRKVLCFHNDENTRWGSLEAPLAEGDVLTILQAVSGGTPGSVSRSTT